MNPAAAATENRTPVMFFDPSQDIPVIKEESTADKILKSLELLFRGEPKKAPEQREEGNPALNVRRREEPPKKAIVDPTLELVEALNRQREQEEKSHRARESESDRKRTAFAVSALYGGSKV